MANFTLRLPWPPKEHKPPHVRLNFRGCLQRHLFDQYTIVLHSPAGRMRSSKTHEHTYMHTQTHIVGIQKDLPIYKNYVLYIYIYLWKFNIYIILYIYIYTLYQYLSKMPRSTFIVYTQNNQSTRMAQHVTSYISILEENPCSPTNNLHGLLHLVNTAGLGQFNAI